MIDELHPKMRTAKFEGKFRGGFRPMVPVCEADAEKLNQEFANLDPHEYGLTEPCTWRFDGCDNPGELVIEDWMPRKDRWNDGCPWTVWDDGVLSIDRGWYDRTSSVAEWYDWLKYVAENFFADNPLNGLVYFHDDYENEGVIRITDNIVEIANEVPVFGGAATNSDSYKYQQLMDALKPFVGWGFPDQLNLVAQRTLEKSQNSGRLR